MSVLKPQWLISAGIPWLLAACAGTPATLPVPDGSARTPVNRVARNDQRPSTPVPTCSFANLADASASKLASTQATFTLDAKKVAGGPTVKVSLIKTLTKIAQHTGLRLRDNDLPDEILEIVPNDDPLEVLRQLAGQSYYRLSLNRATGRLILSKDTPASGVVVLRDSQPVQQIGSPVALATMPKAPLPMVEALRLLAPKDFDIGYADDIDPNIRIDLSKVSTWTDGLERIALQTPYRVVFDWDKKLVYAMPVAGKPKGN